jgi:hypothetical protein
MSDEVYDTGMPWKYDPPEKVPNLKLITELLIDYEQGNEHCCPECIRDVSGGRELHKPDCRLLRALVELNAPEEWC